jgi:Flp pilus assembly protein TadG
MSLRDFVLGLLDEEDGGELLEFGISITVLFTFVFVTIQLCIAFYSYGLISEAAREGSRYAIVRGATCTTGAGSSCTATAAQIETFVNGLGFPNIGGGTMNVVASFPNGNQNPGSPVLVRITYTVPITLAFVPKNSMSFTSSSEMYILQ